MYIVAGMTAFIMTLLIELIICSPYIERMQIRAEQKEMLESVYEYFEKEEAERIIYDLVETYRKNKKNKS